MNGHIATTFWPAAARHRARLGETRADALAGEGVRNVGVGEGDDVALPAVPGLGDLVVDLELEAVAAGLSWTRHGTES